MQSATEKRMAVSLLHHALLIPFVQQFILNTTVLSAAIIIVVFMNRSHVNQGAGCHVLRE